MTNTHNPLLRNRILKEPRGSTLMTVGMVEFIPKSYGGRLTTLFVVRTIAIFCAAITPLCLVLVAVVWHGKQLAASDWLALFGVLIAAAGFQLLAIAAWRRPDLRKITWNSLSDELTLFNHRFVGSFFSFGKLEAKVTLSPQDIRDIRFVRGRGQFLRIQTHRGFVCITNDLQPFDELSDLLSRQRQEALNVAE